MKLKKAIRIAKENELNTVEEMYHFVEGLSLELFDLYEIEDEMNELIHDIENLAFKYDTQAEDICKWSIKEVSLYVQ